MPTDAPGHSQATVASYDTIGVGYNETRRAEPTIVDLFLRHLGAGDGRPILDLACGTGNYTQAIAGGDRRVLGIDISARMLTEARRNRPSIPFVGGDAFALPFGNETLAAVTCCLAIHHFGDLTPPFVEVARVIGQGKIPDFHLYRPANACHVAPSLLAGHDRARCRQGADSRGDQRCPDGS